jgi:retron-type reverse transcriptase
MKRYNNLYEKIYSIENLRLADAVARRGKLDQPGIRKHDENREANLLELQGMIKSKTYRTGEYKKFIVKEPKIREISCLEYFPHRILHHAIMNVIEPILVPTFTADSYSNIKGKGIDAACNALKRALCDLSGTKYFLKLDIQKFYPSIDHDILKKLLRRKIKDNDLLELLDGIIDSASGVPIGNYLSQYFSNLYLTPLDHFIKEQLRVKRYYRYADDIVILAADKPYLHVLLGEIRNYLTINLNLTIKKNYKVWPTSEGIDFLGSVFRHTHIRMRKRIKENFAKEVAGPNRPQVIAGFMGWAKRTNSKRLVEKLTLCSTLKTSTLQQKRKDMREIKLRQSA